MTLNIGALFRISAGVDGQQNVDRLVTRLKDGDKATAGFGSSLGKLRGALATVGVSFGVAQFVQSLTTETKKFEQENARLSGTLRATAYSAGLTKKELNDLADEMERTTLFDGGDVTDAQSTFLKFGNIQKGVFEEGIRLSADLAALIGGDLASAAQTVGRALSSPAEGVGTLERQIGKLTERQKDHIKQLVETNRLGEAQQVVLDILKTRVGGLAEEMNTGLSKAMGDVGKEWRALMSSMGANSGASSVAGTLFSPLVGAMKSVREAIEGDWVDKLRGLIHLLAGSNGKAVFEFAEAAAGRGKQVATGKITGPGGAPIEEWRKAEAGRVAEIARQKAEQDYARKKARDEEAKKNAEAAAKQRASQQQSFLSGLTESNIQLEGGEAALKRYQAALLGISKQAEPLIQKWEVGQAAKKDAEEAQKKAEEELRKREREAAAQETKDTKHDPQRVADFARAMKLENDERLFQIGSIGKSEQETQRLIETRRIQIEVDELLLEMQRDGLEISALNYRALIETGTEAARQRKQVLDAEAAARGNWMNGARSALTEYIDYNKDVAGRTRDMWRNAFGSAEDALVQFAMTGKANFSDLTRSILADFARMEARKGLSALSGWLSESMTKSAGSSAGSSGGSAAGSWISSIGSWIGSLFASANGNVFSNGHALAFAQGGAFTNGIVSRPTLFPIGKMGEAGTEAIMPLSRDARGRLGVSAATERAAAPSVTVQMPVQIDARGADPSVLGRIEQAMRQVESRAVAAVQDAANRGGSFGRAVGRR